MPTAGGGGGGGTIFLEFYSICKVNCNTNYPLAKGKMQPQQFQPFTDIIL